MTSRLAFFCAAALAATSPALKAADRAYQAGRYEDVAPSIARARADGLDRDDTLHAYELEAMTDAAYGQTSKATRAFEELLKVEPAYILSPDASPKVRAIFAEAKLRIAVQNPAAASTRAPNAALASASNQPKKRSVLTRWWFWTGVSVLVLGGAGAAYWATHPPTSNQPAGTLGIERFP